MPNEHARRGRRFFEGSRGEDEDEAGGDLMSRRPALTVQSDIARAIRAARQCGAGAVEIRPDGTIRIKLVEEKSPIEVDETNRPVVL
jgi:hypothetical protein